MMDSSQYQFLQNNYDQFNPDMNQSQEVKTNTVNVNQAKTVVVIDKEKFEICKRLVLENAPDKELATALQIPEKSVRFFKKEMMKFEDEIKQRKRQLKQLKILKKKKENGNPEKSQKREKRDLSITERLNTARDLVGKNYSTSQISKILKISERSVTRIKRKLREERKQLKAEGKIPYDPNNSSDDEESFKFLKSEEKLEKAKELFQQKLTVNDIAKILKISERTARRWKERLTRLDILDIEPPARSKKSQRSARRQVVKTRAEIEDEEDESASESDSYIRPIRKHKKVPKEEPMETEEESFDSYEHSEYTINEEDFNLELPQEDVDDAELKHDVKQEFIKCEEKASRIEQVLINVDPLNFGRTPKVSFTERDVLMVKLLREDNVRTMDIAKMMDISERSVTRLQAKGKLLKDPFIEPSLREEIERMKQFKDNDDAEGGEIIDQLDANKLEIFKNLVSMNVKPKDIAKILNISDRSVSRWRKKIQPDINEGSTSKN